MTFRPSFSLGGSLGLSHILSIAVSVIEHMCDVMLTVQLLFCNSANRQLVAATSKYHSPTKAVKKKKTTNWTQTMHDFRCLMREETNPKVNFDRKH